MPGVARRIVNETLKKIFAKKQLLSPGSLKKCPTVWPGKANKYTNRYMSKENYYADRYFLFQIVAVLREKVLFVG